MERFDESASKIHTVRHCIIHACCRTVRINGNEASSSNRSDYLNISSDCPQWALTAHLAWNSASCRVRLDCRNFLRPSKHPKCSGLYSIIMLSMSMTILTWKARYAFTLLRTVFGHRADILPVSVSIQAGGSKRSRDSAGTR